MPLLLFGVMGLAAAAVRLTVGCVIKKKQRRPFEKDLAVVLSLLCSNCKAGSGGVQRLTCHRLVLSTGQSSRAAHSNDLLL